MSMTDPSQWTAAETLLGAAGILLSIVSVFVLAIVGWQFKLTARLESKFVKKTEKMENQFHKAIEDLGTNFKQLVTRLEDLVEKIHNTDRKNAVAHERFVSLERRVTEVEDRVAWSDERKQIEETLSGSAHRERVNGARAS